MNGETAKAISPFLFTMETPEQTIQKYTPLIMKIINRYSGFYGKMNSKEDLFSIASVVLLKSISEFDQNKCKCSLIVYLQTKITQKIIDVKRAEDKVSSRRKEKLAHISFSSPELEVVGNKLIEENDFVKNLDQKEIISILLKQLDDDQLEVINTIFFKDQEALSLAKLKKVSQGYISQLKSSALCQMRQKLESMEIYSSV